uniref:DB domain-containing protein n=1 Tax=Rhabditophanes sp. KR3021 TaxID=114890 RepID=A0AC35TUL8_9BILA
MFKISLVFLVAFVSVSYGQDGLMEGKCGTAESDFSPCMVKEKADGLFQNCCKLYAPEGCQELCQYESDEIAARNLILNVFKSKKCNLKHISTILFCASQNQDNTKCCEHLKLGDSSLGVGKRCLRYCDPSGQGIGSMARSDVTCLFNWNVLMYCHHSGIVRE